MRGAIVKQTGSSKNHILLPRLERPQKDRRAAEAARRKFGTCSGGENKGIRALIVGGSDLVVFRIRTNFGNQLRLFGRGKTSYPSNKDRGIRNWLLRSAYLTA
jgi:hypothetical protein